MSRVRERPRAIRNRTQEGPRAPGKREERARLPVPWLFVLIAAWFWLGCGHEVDPAPDYSQPADLPLCCVSETGPTCCGLIAFGFAGGIQVDWNAEDAIFGFVDGWALYRAEGESTPPDSAYRRVNPALITFREYLDRDIVNGVRYWYRLASVSPAGVQSLLTPPAVTRADFSAPTPPTGLVASVSNGDVILVWELSPEADLDHYNVFRDPPFPLFVFPRAEEARYTDNHVTAGSAYRYWVTAVDMGFNESAPSETVAVTVPAAARVPSTALVPSAAAAGLSGPGFSR